MKRISLLAAILALLLVGTSAFTSKSYDHEWYKLDANEYVPVEEYTGPGSCINEPGVCVYIPKVENPESDGDFDPVFEENRNFVLP